MRNKIILLAITASSLLLNACRERLIPTEEELQNSTLSTTISGKEELNLCAEPSITLTASTKGHAVSWLWYASENNDYNYELIPNTTSSTHTVTESDFSQYGYVDYSGNRFCNFFVVAVNEDGNEGLGSNVFTVQLKTCDYTDYNSILSSAKSKIFYDGFDNNSNSWSTTVTNSDGYTVTMEPYDGVYNLDYNEEGYFSASARKTISSFNPTENFEIETKIRQYTTYNSGSSFVGLFWGNTSSLRSFIICQDIKYFYFGLITNIWTEWSSGYSPNYSDGTPIFTINTSDYNILTVRRMKNVYYIFINTEFVYSYTGDSISSTDNIVGFMLSQCAAYVDYVSVYKLNI